MSQGSDLVKNWHLNGRNVHPILDNHSFIVLFPRAGATAAHMPICRQIDLGGNPVIIAGLTLGCTACR